MAEPLPRLTLSQPPAALARLIQPAGVAFNGPQPFDIQVKDDRMFSAVLQRGTLGFGEAYVNGWWDCQQLDQLMTRLLAADTEDQLPALVKLQLVGLSLRDRLVNRQSPERAFEVGERHYDVGNDVFESMLDPAMIYSCGYWEGATTSAQAQKDKLRMICEKLELQPGERLLEIGCGWGGLAEYAARQYQVQVLGITVSKEQQHAALARCHGLPVQIELVDYRNLAGEFDKIVSVGMFEHVGLKNYPTFFDQVYRLMSDQGLFLLHTIGGYAATAVTDPWIDRYIFPNGKIPSLSEITRHVEGRWVMEDWHNFGRDYDRTLMAWHDNFVNGWPDLEPRYGPHFYRMWRYYLLTSAGYFRSRKGQLWQLVFSKRQRHGTYRSKRWSMLASKPAS